MGLGSIKGISRQLEPISTISSEDEQTYWVAVGAVVTEGFDVLAIGMSRAVETLRPGLNWKLSLATLLAQDDALAL